MREVAEAADGGRTSEQKALHVVAQFILQELPFGVGPDAFRQHEQTKPAQRLGSHCDKSVHFRLCSIFEISNLRIERTLEGRPRGAALDIGCEAFVARDDVGVFQGTQHRRHH
jgi:hypothetical protein